MLEKLVPLLSFAATFHSRKIGEKNRDCVFVQAVMFLMISSVWLFLQNDWKMLKVCSGTHCCDIYAWSTGWMLNWSDLDAWLVAL